ncbi:hypothetical protein PCANC_28773 [Puccinia coronata f. sp. avenae]|uniref:Uncharacterized protein n=1 Tax=Puccinia coronata f. sp. avenae TaxID=200324 RepID=A0A2N5RZU2_9BASI|nr:hypothetical protein PCANC_28773 [Puccinia coronata f. sp. avenae]
MASEVERLMAKDTGVNPNLKTLGYVPNLVPIVEESEEIEEDAHFVAEDVILGSNVNSQIENSAEQEENLDVVGSDDADSSETPGKAKNPIDAILKKVNFVIQRITFLAVKQSEYSSWSKKLEIDGPSLIAGYGIRWNIKYESRNRGYQGRKIISKLLENEKD